MGESQRSSETEREREEVIAAFDRERSIAQELNRQYAERVRKSRHDDQPVCVEVRRHSQ